MVSGSFNGFVTKLRTKLEVRFHGKHKLVTAYHYNDAWNLSATAVADMDFAWTVGFDPNLYTSPSSPWINAKWSAQMPNMNQTYNAIYLNQIRTVRPSLKMTEWVQLQAMICVFIPNAIRCPLFRRSVKVFWRYDNLQRLCLHEGLDCCTGTMITYADVQ